MSYDGEGMTVDNERNLSNLTIACSLAISEVPEDPFLFYRELILLKPWYRPVC